MKIYCQIVDHLAATYSTDDVIVNAAADLFNFRHPEEMSAVHYSEMLWKRALHCGLVLCELL